MHVGEFNSTSRDEAISVLTACCDVPAWAARVADGRPFASVDELVALAEREALTWREDDIEQALTGHPRIGATEIGADAQGFSRREQQGVGPEDIESWAGANERYEDRFGKIFLICASGLSSQQMHDALETRLSNDADTESRIRIEELRKIMLHRLRRSVRNTAAHEKEADAKSSLVSTHVLDVTNGRGAAEVSVELLGPAREVLGAAATDQDGRIKNLGPTALPAGPHSLVFHLGPYWQGLSSPSLFPAVELTVEVDPTQEHYHVPMLISPWSISGYRGT